jgi:hypothetical protein
MDERFHCGLNIAGYCPTMASENLQGISPHTIAPAITAKLIHIYESLANSVLIIDTLEQHLVERYPIPSASVH